MKNEFALDDDNSKNSSDLEQHCKRNSKRNKRHFKAYLKECKFGLVKEIILNSGATEADLKEDWTLAWMDASPTLQEFIKLKPYQKINHFPGMKEICKKDLLANNLKLMKQMLPQDYNFFPLTFCLPNECRNLIEYSGRKKNQDIFIIKPDTFCQGNGIKIVKGIKNPKKYHGVVCQKYISKPFLMDKFKMDLRLYVLITSIDPLRIFLYKEGLVRLATIPYRKPTTSNLGENRMHLTNYAINRHAKEFMKEDASNGCKKSFADLDNYLHSMNVSTVEMWVAIEEIIVKTILCALPKLRHTYHVAFPGASTVSRCFEVLGFDILLDSKTKPFLLEVNRSPSFGSSCAIDVDLKGALIKNVLEMVLLTSKQINFIKEGEHSKAIRRLTNPSSLRNLTIKEKTLSEQVEQNEDKKIGNFKKIYPVENDKYDEIYKVAFESANIKRN